MKKWALRILFVVVASVSVQPATFAFAKPTSQIAIGCENGASCFYRLIPVYTIIDGHRVFLRYGKVWTCVCIRPRQGR